MSTLGRGLSVNGEHISTDRIRAEMSRLRQEAAMHGVSAGLKQRLGLRSEAMERLIDRILLRQEARRLELTPDEGAISQGLANLLPRGHSGSGCRADFDTPEAREDVEYSISIDRVLTAWCANVRPPRPADVRERYRKFREEFRLPERVNAAHIVRNVSEGDDRESRRAEAEQLRARVAAGAEFTEVARTHSDCPENCGELGWFTRGIMVEEFEEVTFSAAPGTLTPVFQTRFGFHFALVRDHRPAEIAPFEGVREQIQVALIREKQDREVGRRLDALRRRAIITEAAQ